MKTMKVSLAQKILERIQKIDPAFVWPGGMENVSIQRTYSGRNQRAAGSWSWYLKTIDGQYCPDIGSGMPAKDIANPKNEISIFCPVDFDSEIVVDRRG